MIPGSMPGLVIATVVDNRDPSHHGRVIVSYPWLDQSYRSDWISVAQPNAGKDRGMFWMPEPGDEMVVGFLNGDFHQPIVLGAMWNPVNPPPSPDPRQRMLRSVNGHTIRFVDSTVTAGDKGALIIEDAHGNVISLSNGFVSIRSTALLSIEANAILLRGNGWQRTVTPNNNPI
jgi:phage baseplate assembly protein V